MTFNTRKLVPLSLALAMGLAVASPAFADEGSSGSDSKKSSSDKADSEKSSSSGDEGGAQARGKKKVSAEPAPGSKVFLAALGGWGSSSPTRGGLGLRGALEVSPDLYVGLLGQYFFGEGDSNDALGGTSSWKSNIILAGAEVGYEVEVAADFSMRPYFGLGAGIPMSENCSNDECYSDTNVTATLNPGLMGLYHAGVLALGADFRYLVVIAEANTSAMVASAVVGLEF